MSELARGLARILKCETDFFLFLVLILPLSIEKLFRFQTKLGLHVRQLAAIRLPLFYASPCPHIFLHLCLQCRLQYQLKSFSNYK